MTTMTRQERWLLSRALVLLKQIHDATQEGIWVDGVWTRNIAQLVDDQEFRTDVQTHVRHLTHELELDQIKRDAQRTRRQRQIDDERNPPK